MSKINTGGPAFPIDYETAVETAGGDVSMYGTGMSLRDYFAAKAMTGFLATGEADSILAQSDMDWPGAIASDSYAMADAMLKARERS